jgi:tetratricopeptide (TPR) repeat protein
MTYKEIGIKYSEICSNLAQRRLKPAFDKLGVLISETGLGVYYDEYRNLDETYQFMLKYTVEGIPDPDRDKVYRKLIVSVFELADKVNEDLRLRYSLSVEYDQKRSFRNKFISNLDEYLKSFGDSSYHAEPEFGAELQDEAANYHNRIRRLFYHVWFHDKLTPEETDALRSFLNNPEIDVPYRSFIVSALMISLLRHFDTEKFSLLFDSFVSEEPGIKQRAIVGFIINLYKYDARLPFYPAIKDRLKILNENMEFRQSLEKIIIQIIRSKETEKLQQRIKDEILPEMIKISPNFKNKINLESLMEEGLSEDKNPDWEEIFKDSPELLNKIEEFSELQMKGSDVFMGSFARLKTFPFYNDMSNWFMPFFPENPEIADILGTSDQTNRHLIEAIDKAPILCNSDKYSFCFSIRSLPKENLEFMMQAMQAEMEQIKELQDDEIMLDPGKRSEFISNQFIQDLYRFFKLYPRKSDFDDIFGWRFDFHNRLILGDILKEDLKILKNIAEYYFATNHFEESAELFHYLVEKEQNGEMYQKIAYSHQKSGDFGKALEAYLKAELYDSNRLWNLKKIALCYRNLKQPAKALEYYREAEKIDPDSLANQLNIGHSLLELDEYEQALKCYFKVEYLAPGNKKVWRPIAWCSFLTGKKEQAEKYFLKLLEDDPGRHDLINMGHVQWSLGKRREALDYYLKSISGDGFSEEEFLEVFNEDLPHLLDQGINNDDVPIILDQLRYLLEKK